MYKIIRYNRDLARVVLPHWDLQRARSLFKVAAIDDQAFTPGESLKLHGYQIAELGDIASIDVVADFPIVVCDIKGVGAKFDNKYEGGHLIKEIKKRFPDKYVISFSGQRFDQSYQRFFQLADDFIKKDADSDEWVERLDVALRSVAHPIERWKRVRRIMLSEGIEVLDLLRLEQAVVKSVLEGSDVSMTSAMRSLPGGAVPQIGIEATKEIGRLILQLAAAGLLGS